MHKITEARLHSADVGEIFKKAAAYKNAPKGLGKIFKQFRKDVINPKDIHQAWVEAGSPLTLNRIKNILLKFGFSEKDINSIFTNMFGKSTNKNEPFETPRQSSTIMKVANFAKKNKIDGVIRDYLEKEYGFSNVDENLQLDSIGIGRIFEEASLLSTRITIEDKQTSDRQNLGRARK